MRPAETPHSFDPEALIRVLGRHEVDYVAIGGVAVIAHGSRRTTRDLDIVPAPDPENYERLAAALEELDAAQLRSELEFRALDPSDPVDVARAGALVLDTRAGRLDVFNGVAPGTAYEDLRERSLEVTYEGVEVRVIGLDDLIATKRATARELDLIDIADLTDRPESRPPEG